ANLLCPSCNAADLICLPFSSISQTFEKINKASGILEVYSMLSSIALDIKISSPEITFNQSPLHNFSPLLQLDEIPVFTGTVIIFASTNRSLFSLIHLEEIPNVSSVEQSSLTINSISL